MLRALCCLLLALPTMGHARESADTIFRAGNIYTGNEKQPKAEAIAVKGDRIVFVGSAKDADAYKSEQTRLVDLKDHTVVPGLTDAHCHIFGIGEREMTLNLEGTKTLEDFLGKVKDRVAKTDSGKWITGRGWIETFWSPPDFPTAHQLDEIVPNHPVFLTRADGHAAIANSAALRAAGINGETEAPFGGGILKANGAPTGTLIDNAMELVARHIPSATAREIEEAFMLGVKRSTELGWCQVQNAGSSIEESAMMRKLIATGKVKLRIYNAVSGPGERADQLLKNGAVIGDRFTQRTIKCEPMIEFYAAVARKSLDGESREGWHPEQAVSREQALKMFTIWPAFAAFQEKERGTLEVGKLADLTVLSADIMKIPAPEILKARCVMTLIGGEIVHQE